MPACFETTIDLRQIPPPARDALILRSFSGLLPGQSLELVNDHDPQTLNAQFELRSPGLFSWNYLEQGPRVWRVQVGRSAQAVSAAPGSCCSGGACGG